MQNIPEVKLGLIAVSRDCFPIALSEKRRSAIVKTCGGNIYECPVTVENETDMLKAVEDVKAAGCNALVVFLGNFGPETPETLIAKYFDGPCMFVKNLKIITFGPRPQDFLACNAPIKGLYELGVEVEENSELDLLVSYKAHAGDKRIPEVCADMAAEMGEGRYYPEGAYGAV